ncbi:ScbR family autoregulator-binding transcription factor [Agromyces salentinus]|uniref:ScbR family autoregulator-binding transcription factor n=1 Tax=Agromyces salentinus TaxID=269421 RepID=A0ABN2ME27_9MICO|nr:ScbR family autoregulator-binding transcription factor [Agromyces salentinus]
MGDQVKQARARATHERIVAGAAEVFERVGYGSSTLADITAEAGVTKGALYFHFQSKEDVAHAVVEAQHSIARTAAEEIVGAELTPLETMMRLCADLAVRIRDDRVVQAGIRLTTDSSTFQSPLQSPYLDWMATFEALARRAGEAGEMTTAIDAATFARFVIPAFTGVQLVSDTFTSRADVVERVHDMWRVLICATVPSAATTEALALAEVVFTGASNWPVPAAGQLHD